MVLPNFGFTRKDKIFLGSLSLVLTVLTVSFIIFLNIKVKEKTKLSEITPAQNIFSRQQTVSPPMTLAVSKSFSFTASAEPDSGKKDELPIDYTVKEIRAEEAILTSSQGEVTITNNPNIHIFFGYPPSSKPAAFADLAVGKKLRLQRIHGQAAWLYILN